MPDIIILGSGPAGISAAIYAVRAGLKAVVIGRDGGSLAKSEKIENYYGFVQPVSGQELIQAGIEQAKRLGAEVVSGEVLGIGYGETGFEVFTKDASFQADAVVLATGSSRRAPKLAGLAEFEGKGVSYCAVCDAFFYKGKDVAVLGDGEYALHEAAELLPIVSSVTLLTNGGEAPAEAPPALRTDTRKLAALEGESVLNAVRFEDGTTLAVSGVFVALGVAGSGDLARKLGAELRGASVAVDEEMQATVPGLFAAGDCTGGMLQVAKAVYEGARAGTSAVKYVRAQKRQS